MRAQVAALQTPCASAHQGGHAPRQFAKYVGTAGRNAGRATASTTAAFSRTADIWQAAYTAGVVIPKPVSSCQYYHRSINAQKLIEIGFSRLAPRMTMQRTKRLYALPDVRASCRARACAECARAHGAYMHGMRMQHPSIAGVRAMEPRDVAASCKLVNTYLDK